jgi:hypothetical protein
MLSGEILRCPEDEQLLLGPIAPLYPTAPLPCCPAYPQYSSS